MTAPIIILSSSLASLLAVHWIYFKILHVAKAKKLVDNPNARKLQKAPVPIMGGIAVFFGLAAGLITGSILTCIPALAAHTAIPFPSVSLLQVVCVMVLMLYIGALDDIMGLSAMSRLVIEISVVLALIITSGQCIDTFRGMWGIYEFSWWIAIPFTVFAGTGIINAVNMIDGVNGLSSGLCIVYSVLFGIAFLNIGDVPDAVLAFSVVGALLPFFMHNVFGLKSRMFLGDAGTMVMGVLMVWFTLSLLSSSCELTADAQRMNVVALCLSVLSVPVFDTLRVMIMRMVHKRSPFTPDKNHLHHLFIKIGASHAFTAFSIILMDLAVFMCWVIACKCGAGLEVQLYVVVVAAAVLVWGAYALLSYHIKRHTAVMHELVSFSVRTHLGRTEWWKYLTALLDAPEDRVKIQQEVDPKFDNDRFANANPDDLKECDRKLLLDFMKGKSEVLVEDIRQHSGVEPMRVYPLLFEEVQLGTVEVIKFAPLGTPEIVALVDE